MTALEGFMITQISQKELTHLNDDELLTRTQEKAAQERMLTAEVLKMLSEINRRRLYAARGYSSLFQFCIEFLGYSEGSAQRRISSLRLLNTVPELEEKIKNGTLTLSHLSRAQSFFQMEAKADHQLSVEEKKSVLKKLEGKSTREAERTLIALASAPDNFSQKEKIRIVSETHSEVKFYANQELLDKLEQIRGLLGHVNPNFSTAELIEKITDLALEKLRPRKPKEQPRKKSRKKPQEKRTKEEKAELTADTKSTSGDITARADSRPAVADVTAGAGNKTLPEAATTPPRSRVIPAHVKSEVYYRDGGKCTYVDPKTGRKCESKYQIEYDHSPIPFAMGGPSTPSNLQIKCRAHNQYEAVLRFGEKKTRASRATTAAE